MDKEQRTLDALKAASVSQQPIPYPSVTSENYILYSDTSTVGLGGCLAQNIDGRERVISYRSRKLLPREKNLCGDPVTIPCNSLVIATLNDC